MSEVKTITEIIYYITQMIAACAAVVCGIIAIKEYKSSRKKELELKKKEVYLFDKERVQRAVEAGHFYKDKILDKSRELKRLHEKIGMYEIFESVNMDNILHFDIHELSEIFTNEQRKKIKDIRNTYKIETQMKDLSVAYRKAKEFTLNEEIERGVNDKSENKEIEAVSEKYVDLSMDILNNLELFAMCFVHETADHSVVYQPLHMSYLEIVRMLYCDIAYANRDGEKRFYVNTIALFNIWKQKAREQREKDVEKSRELVEKGKILDTFE